MWLVVGLGNPGREYASHRHNVGFMALDELARMARADSPKEKFSAEYTRLTHAGEDAVLLKPQTFMNLSGQSVQPAAAFFKVPIDRVLVVHDELDVPFGEVRLKVGGGHAGHNGLRSIIERMGGNGFARVRIGIGRPPAGFRGEVADYVLSSFDGSERAELPDVIARAARAVTLVMEKGLSSATNTLHAGDKKKQKTSAAAAPAGATKETPPRSGADGSGATSPRGKA